MTAGIAALIVVAGTPAAADRSPSRTGLRAQHAALTARARSALYELYAQDAQLARARANERRQAARVAALDEQVRTQTGIVQTARANLGVARNDLRQRILERYKSDRLDPLEVLLGSNSLADALHRADTLQQVQSGDRDLVERTLAARDELDGQLRSLQAARNLTVSEHYDPHEVTAYEELLTDAIRGVTMRFARQDYVEEAWRIVDPVLDDATPVFEYEPGSWGPAEASRVAPAGGWVDLLAAEHAPAATT